MKRTAMVVAVAAAVLATMAWPASAKGEGPVSATITGPGIGSGGGPGVPGGPGGSGGSNGSNSGSGGGSNLGGGAAVGTITIGNKAGLEPFRNNALWRLASFSGMVPGCSTCTSYIDTSQPADRASLGPVYRVTYFAGKCCDNAVRQLLYPFAPGGPWAFNTTDVGHDFFLLSHNTGWWHAEGRMGVLFTRFLRHTGIPKSNPVAVSAGEGAAAAEASSATAASSTPWAIPVAIAVMALLLVAGAAAARPRSSGHPA
jgi:hypothetical protein